MRDDASTHEPTTASHKANFDTIYDEPDPRPFFTTLGPLGYQIPQNARPVIEAVHRAVGPDRPILDVCCSYGINGALLRFDADLREVIDHYTGLADDAADPEDFASADRAFFAARPRRPQPTVLGLDAAKNAVDYARLTNLISDGWAENLETAYPSPALSAGVRDVGLIACTGGVGYIGAPTFARLLEQVAAPDRVTLAVWVLRVFAYDEIAAALDAFGLVTEQVPGRTFRQRRFATADEQESAVQDVVDRGLDPAGKEADGWFHADCFISRPAAAIARTPLAQLLA